MPDHCTIIRAVIDSMSAANELGLTAAMLSPRIGVLVDARLKPIGLGHH